MEVFDDPRYKYQQYLLRAIGQWPYQKSSRSAARQILILILLISFLHVQGIKIILSRRDMPILIETVPTFLTSMGITVKFMNCWINRSKFKVLLNRIPIEWQSLAGKDEVRVMEEYVETGKILSLFYIWIIYVFLALFLSLQIIPELVNILTPFNMSRFSKPPFQGEYFVDPKKYFYHILLHMDITIVVGLTAMVASDVAFITIVLHACGMFGVLCYRLEHLFDKDMSKVDQTKMIANVVRYHLQILEYVRLINSCYAFAFIIQFFLVVGILSILLVHISSVLTNKDNKDDLMICMLNICGHFLVVFLDIVPGQMLLDCKSDMFHKVYDNKWYNTPAKVQSLLILIMHMCVQPGGINVANIFVSSFQIFATIVHSSTSYFMVLYSLQ